MPSLTLSNLSAQLTEETVSVVDGLLGDTETSKALAAFAHLWHDIIKGRSEEMGYSNMPFGNLFMLGHIAKSLMVRLFVRPLYTI